MRAFSLFIILFFLLFVYTTGKATTSSTIVDIEAEVKDIDWYHLPSCLGFYPKRAAEWKSEKQDILEEEEETIFDRSILCSTPITLL